MPYDASPDAVRVLLDTYWSSAGWRRPPVFPDRSHDEWVKATVDAVCQVDGSAVEEAFLASLGSRRLDLRSALGSYAVARRLEVHAFEAGPSRRCGVCGLAESPPPTDRNVLNFERFKWGGVRRDDLTYVWHDLEQFGQAPRQGATKEDIDLGRRMLAALRAVPATESVTKAVARLSAVKGNKAEREVLLDILGVCDVLGASGHRGFRSDFVRHDQRELPAQRFVDRAYPVCWWKGEDSVNQDAVDDFLPSLI
jgi:hypothetical protein